MKLKQRPMTYELWCRFNDLDPANLDSNFEKYLDWREDQWELNHQQTKQTPQ